MPALIKRHFASRAGTLMALFTTGIMAGAAVAAASAAPLASHAGLTIALMLPSLPALIALILWLRLQPVTTRVNTPPAGGVHRTPRAAVDAVLASAPVLTSLVLAWLPPFYMQHGWLPAQSGYVLGALTLTEVAAGFMLSALIHRCRDRAGRCWWCWLPSCWGCSHCGWAANAPAADAAAGFRDRCAVSAIADRHT